MYMGWSIEMLSDRSNKPQCLDFLQLFDQNRISCRSNSALKITAKLAYHIYDNETEHLRITHWPLSAMYTESYLHLDFC